MNYAENNAFSGAAPDPADTEGDVFLFAAPAMSASVTGYGVSESGLPSPVVGLSDGVVDPLLAIVDLTAQDWPAVAHYGDETASELATAAAPMGVAGWTMMSGPEFRDALALASFGDLLFTGRRMGGLSTMKWEGDGSVRNLRNAAVSLGHFVELEIAEDLEEDFLTDPLGPGSGLPSWRLPASTFSGSGEVTFGADLGPMMVTVVNGVPFVVAGGEAGNAFATLSVGETDPLTATDRMLHGIDTGIGTQGATYGDAGPGQLPHVESAGHPGPENLETAPWQQSLGILGDEAEDSFQFRSFEERAALSEALGGYPDADEIHAPDILIEAASHDGADAYDLAQPAHDADLPVSVEITSLDPDLQMTSPEPGDLPF